MRPKKFYIPIGVCLFLLAVGFLALRSNTPTEPITIYKTVEPLAKSTVKTSVGEVPQGGHFHADGTFHAQPHAIAEKKGNLPSPDAVDQAAMDALPTEKSNLVKEQEAYIKELEASIASYKEMGEIRAWFDENLDPLITELRPFFAEAVTGDTAAVEAFFDTHYPTREAKLDAAQKLLKLTDMCREFLSRIDASSELSRDRFYEELESGNGWLFGLQDPVYLPTVKQFIAYYGGDE
jgi:hypothetical protein